MSKQVEQTRLAAFKDGLKEYYGADVYTSYFEPLDIGSCDADHATLVAKNRLAADRICTRYASGVHQLWCEHVGPVDYLEVMEERGVPSYIRKPVSDEMPSRQAATAPLMARAQAETSVAPAVDAQNAPTSEIESLSGTVNPNQTLGNFCINDTNRMAALAVQRLISETGASVTYLYGDNGFGKSHLLSAACNEYRRCFPGRRIMFLTYESLVADVSDAVVSRSVKELRAHLNDTDLLVFDDVQLLRGRKRTQEELACLIERFRPLGKPILVAGTLRPSELAETGIAHRLTDRLGGGASVRIGRPDTELRMQLANRWAELFERRTRIEIAPRHLEFLARRSDVSVREFQGILEYFELAIEARTADESMTDAWVREVLAEKLVAEAPQTTLEDIFTYTANVFGVTSAEMRSASRRRALVRTRQAFCLAARMLTTDSLKAIGGMIDRDHTTVMHSVEQAEIFAGTDKVFGQRINQIFEYFGR